MLQNEALWIRERLSRVAIEDLSPVLNVGSATAEFRTTVQPWIDQQIFLPLRERGVRVHYTDLQDGPGIDFSGDLYDDRFFKVLMAHQYRTILCCNLLEHVTDPQSLCIKLQQLAHENAYIVVTVPRAFPYHPDPIDTRFRPTPNEIQRLFPHCRMLYGDIIDCGTGWDYVGRELTVLLRSIRRRLTTRDKHGGIKGSASFAPWLFRQFRQTCVLLQKQVRVGDKVAMRPNCS